jgi:heme A synthase
VLFLVLPFLFYELDDTPQRSMLKEAISLITLFAFIGLLFQFYLSHSNETILKARKIRHIVKWHKVLGFFFEAVVMLGITSLLRKKVLLSYKSWHVFHGVLSIIFIIMTSCLVIKMGRHISTPMA